MIEPRIDPERIQDYYFPVSLGQVEGLIESMLIHLEALGLPREVEDANRILIRRTLWKWWSDAQENSLTSWRLCIGPIERVNPAVPGADDTYRWLTDVGEVVKPPQPNPAAQSCGCF